MKLRRSITGSLALGVVLIGGACTSNPSSEAVVLDMIEALPAETEDGSTITDGVRTCMTTLVDDMTGDDLEVIAKSDPDFTSANGDADASPEMQAFIDDLRDCISAG